MLTKDRLDMIFVSDFGGFVRNAFGSEVVEAATVAEAADKCGEPSKGVASQRSHVGTKWKTCHEKL